MLKIRYLTEPSLQDFQEWQELWSNSPDATLFNSPAWFKACRRAFPQREPLIIMAMDEDYLGAILLLEKQRNKWTLMGRPYMDRASLLLEPSFIFQYGHQLLSTFIKKLEILEFSELREHQLEMLLKASNKLLNTYCQYSLNPRFKIDEPTLSSKEKVDIRRLTRRLSESGNWSVEFHSINEKSFLSMYKIELASHKISKNQTLLDRTEVKNLFITLGSMSKGYVAFLIHNGEPIAHLLGWIQEKTFLVHNMSYKQAWRSYAPGKLLVYHMLPSLKEKGILYFDFSRGQNSLKQKFSNISIPQYGLTLFDKSYQGYTNYLIWQLEQLLDLMRLKIALHLPSSWKDKFRPYLSFWLDRRK